MEGTFRYLDKEMGDMVIARMNEIVTATAKAHRGEAELIELSSVPPLTNDNDLLNEITGYVKDIVSERGVSYLKVAEWVLRTSHLIHMKCQAYTSY